MRCQCARSQSLDLRSFNSHLDTKILSSDATPSEISVQLLKRSTSSTVVVVNGIVGVCCLWNESIPRMWHQCLVRTCDKCRDLATFHAICKIDEHKGMDAHSNDFKSVSTFPLAARCSRSATASKIPCGWESFGNKTHWASTWSSAQRRQANRF